MWTRTLQISVLRFDSPSKNFQRTIIMKKLTIIFTLAILIVVISMLPNASPCAGKRLKIKKLKSLVSAVADAVKKGFWKLKDGRMVKFHPVPFSAVNVSRKFANGVFGFLVRTSGDFAGHTLAQNLLQEDCHEAMEEAYKTP